MMLQVVPTHWYSWDVTVTDESRPVADITLSWWREKGALTIDDSNVPLSAEAPISGDFVLEHAGGVLARAEKPSVFRRRVRDPSRRPRILASPRVNVSASVCPPGRFAASRIDRAEQCLHSQSRCGSSTRPASSRSHVHRLVDGDFVAAGTELMSHGTTPITQMTIPHGDPHAFIRGEGRARTNAPDSASQRTRPRQRLRCGGTPWVSRSASCWPPSPCCRWPSPSSRARSRQRRSPPGN